jgi:hypothetical protein
VTIPFRNASKGLSDSSNEQLRPKSLSLGQQPPSILNPAVSNSGGIR